MRAALLALGLVMGGLVWFGTSSEDAQAQGCQAFGQFIAGSAQAPGPFGQLVQERVPNFSEDVAAFHAALCS